MRKPTRRKLLWIGAALIVLPTVALIIIFFQPHEYHSTIFIEVAKPGVVKHAAPVDHTALYAILMLIGIYFPGLMVILTGLLIHPSQASASGSLRI
jgi:hypothetical protein